MKKMLIKRTYKETDKAIKENAPCQLNEKMILQEMSKEGSQSHIYSFVSRKDMSNTYSLSEGST